MGNYAELLKDPRWQRKRLEVMKAANFECCECGEGKKTLHVHHGYYEKDLKPWEYPDDSLHCLCEECHEKYSPWGIVLRREIGKLSPSHLEQILGHVVGIRAEGENIDIHFTSQEVLCGLAFVWNLDPEKIWKCIGSPNMKLPWKGKISSDELWKLTKEKKKHGKD